MQYRYSFYVYLYLRVRRWNVFLRVFCGLACVYNQAIRLCLDIWYTINANDNVTWRHYNAVIILYIHVSQLESVYP